MPQKPEPAVSTKVAEAIEHAYGRLSGVAPALEKDGTETNLMPYKCKLSDTSKGPPIPANRGIYDDEKAKAVIAEAKAGERMAHVVLMEVAKAMIDRFEPLPRNLGRYMLEVARDGLPKWKRGQSLGKFFYRDNFIAAAVAEVCHRFGISKTRNHKALKPGRDTASACFVVQAALRRLHKEGAIGSVPTERTIEKIYEEIAKRRARPGHNYDYWHLSLAVQECRSKT